MQLREGQVAVVTGAAGGIGRALGVETIGVPTDVSDAAAVDGLAAAALERFGAVHVLCNNAGVASTGDPWFGPISGWQWVLGVNLWGVIHGVRAFLPALAGQEESHIVNTASIAGLVPGFGPSYDASKHAVVAISEDLYRQLQMIGLPIGVSVLCPGWVRTGIVDADRNWPDELGEPPPAAPGFDVMADHVRRAVDEGAQPSYVADLVAAAVESDSFWVFPHPEFVELAIRRWHGIAEGLNPEPMDDVPGLPPADELRRQVMERLAPPVT